MGYHYHRPESRATQSVVEPRAQSLDSPDGLGRVGARKGDIGADNVGKSAAGQAFTDVEISLCLRQPGRAACGRAIDPVEQGHVYPRDGAHGRAHFDLSAGYSLDFLSHFLFE